MTTVPKLQKPIVLLLIGLVTMVTGLSQLQGVFPGLNVRVGFLQELLEDKAGASGRHSTNMAQAERTLSEKPIIVQDNATHRHWSPDILLPTSLSGPPALLSQHLVRGPPLVRA